MHAGVLTQYAAVLELRSSTRQGVEMIFGSAHKNILQDNMFYYFDDLTKDQFVFCERVYKMLKSTLVPCETADAAYKLHDALRNKQTRRNAGPTENKNVTKMRTELVQKLTAFRESYAATIGDYNLEQLKNYVPYPAETDGFDKWYGSYSDLYFRRPCIVKWGDGGLPISDLKFTMKPVKNKNKTQVKKPQEVPQLHKFVLSFPEETNAEYYKTVTVDKLKPDGDAAVLKEKCIALRQAATEWLQRHSTVDISAATDAALHLTVPVPAVESTYVPPPAAAAAAAAAIDAKSSATASTTTATATVDKTSTQSAAAAAAAAAVTDVRPLAPSSTTPTPPPARSDAVTATATVDTADTTAVSTVKPTSPTTLLPSKATIAHLWNPADCKKAIDAVCNERNFLVNDDYYADFPQAQAEATMTAIINYFTCVRKACDLLRDGDKWAKQRITELNKKKETAGAL
eukprot:19864-Heterococcus_DN1.PRE.1